MKILLLGKNGQVGWELQRSLSPLGDLCALGRKDVDMEDLDALRRTVQHLQPDIIVNAAAYTSVDKAETEPERAFLINSEAVGVLAIEANKTNSLLIHYSTDYVYDGKKLSPYNEEDKTSPKSIYGNSKLQGEQLILNSHDKHLIFRTSWVYGIHGHNFVKTILKLSKEKDSLKIVNDQYGAPTSAELIADITALVLFKIRESHSKNYWGTYNLVANGDTSWFGFAQAIIRQAQQSIREELKVQAENIQPIPTQDFPLPAFRPSNSRLDTSKLSKEFNVKLPDWNYHVRRLVDELTNKGIT